MHTYRYASEVCGLEVLPQDTSQQVIWVVEVLIGHEFGTITGNVHARMRYILCIFNLHTCTKQTHIKVVYIVPRVKKIIGDRVQCGHNTNLQHVYYCSGQEQGPRQHRRPGDPSLCTWGHAFEDETHTRVEAHLQSTGEIHTCTLHRAAAALPYIQIHRFGYLLI